MRTVFFAVQSEAKFLNFMKYQLNRMNFNLTSLYSMINNLQFNFHQNEVSTNQMAPETCCLVQFKSQQKINIILKRENSETDGEVIISKKTVLQTTVKSKTKCIQKETRNISSNLLRIFFKNLIELQIYSSKIDNILSKMAKKERKEQFYRWIQKFSVNFKNYIRESIILKIMAPTQPLHFRTVFSILLEHYSQNIGLLHCLTSKRIERKSVKMHLKGLREMKEMKGQERSFKQ